MLWGYFAAAGGTGALHKINGITKRKEYYVDIVKQHLKTSVRNLKLCRKWVFQMDNDPKAYFQSCEGTVGFEMVGDLFVNLAFEDLRKAG